MTRRWARPGFIPAGLALCVALALAGCGGLEDPGALPSESSTPTPTRTATSTPAPTTEPDHLVGECQGTGSPTVVLNAGLGTTPDAFASLLYALPSTVRVCGYARAGLGDSPALPADADDPSAGSQADELIVSLVKDGIEPPYVLVGWSYGGIVTQAFAHRHPDTVAGVVFEDSSVVEQFADPDWDFIEWTEGGRTIDTDASTRDIAGLTLDSLPVVVLTQDQLTPDLARPWLRSHERLAALSTNSIHLIAVGSGHEIHEDATELMAAAIEEVVMAVRSGSPLAACDDRFTAVGGRCR
ncbi:MAG TPA: alpha/beta fold hydrolase [Nocardioidaceae bacterium]|nr:alpha/beta fold hydrolase [Nocardioidaceae bacterium]